MVGRYGFERSQMFYERYTLALDDDGTFYLHVAFSDPAGWAGAHDVRGRWEQTGDAIRFAPAPIEPGETELTTATVVGDELHVAGLGAFARAT